MISLVFEDRDGNEVGTIQADRAVDLDLMRDEYGEVDTIDVVTPWGIKLMYVKDIGGIKIRTW